MAKPLSFDDLDYIRTRTRDLWSEMRGQRIFITGGTGFFGCWLVESFLHINRVEQLGAQCTVLTRNPAAFALKCPHLASDPALSLLAGNVSDFPFPEGDFRFVIHAATEASAKLSAEKPLEMLDTILQGTQRTLEFAAARGTQKFLLTSSGAVYGEQPPSITHLAEDYPGAPNQLDPASVYAEGKRAAELMCSIYGATHPLECKIARCFAFVGPHLPLGAHFAIGNFIRDAMRGDSIRVNGDGTPKRSYLYAADLAIWLWAILFRAPPLEAFNVGSNQAVSISELAHTVVAAIGSNAEVRIMQPATEGARIRQYIPSVQKVRDLLGLECEITLEDAIRRTVMWHGYSLDSDHL
ncbi:NAD-dependent epimerase/dehydratase family protein [Acidicapsa acidisoli]|uniref:NAD-dependent epimerase/dehydratase family protein n=1 Tax=Acidicapsa acidisoli TaxID=1615681 RepID=UPI0021E0AF84|nr:NAD(P)-dependent oxidoreductase [Acidicapsa acidisoli]